MTEPLFIPLAKFAEYGLPRSKGTAYKYEKLGRLKLLTDSCGRRGVTLAEAHRFLTTPPPSSASKRDTSAGTIASLRARGYHDAADRVAAANAGE